MIPEISRKSLLLLPNWTAELELEVPQEGMTINYSYQIEQNGIVIRKEWDSFSRSIFLSGSSRKIYRINDCWKNIPEQLYLYSSAFTEALLAHPEKENIPQRYKKGLVIKAYAPRINKDYCLAICGNQKSLGHWDPEKAVRVFLPAVCFLFLFVVEDEFIFQRIF